MTVLSRILKPSVAVETPPVDAAAVLDVVADAFLGRKSTGRAQKKKKKRRKEEKDTRENSNSPFLHYRRGITTSVRIR
jgi:hypothetical protein